jgi:hypothetical protein
MNKVIKYLLGGRVHNSKGSKNFEAEPFVFR